MNRVHRYVLMNKYKIVLETLEYFLNKSFEVIYNDQIIGYTSSGTKAIPNDEQETIERNFIKLSFEIMGSRVEKNVIDFFGNRKVVMSHMILFFRKKLIGDQLAQLFQEHQLEKIPNE